MLGLQVVGVLVKVQGQSLSWKVGSQDQEKVRGVGGGSHHFLL
jgi:hypothetical protein